MFIIYNKWANVAILNNRCVIILYMLYYIILYYTIYYIIVCSILFYSITIVNVVS
jgi:hypothetical protein